MSEPALSPSTTPAASSAADSPARRAAAGLFGGFALLAIVDAGAIEATVSWPTAGTGSGVGLRAAHHFFDAAETLGLGLVVAVVAYAIARVTRARAWLMGAFLLAFNLALVLRYEGQALHFVTSHAQNGRHPDLWFAVGVAALTGGMTVSPFLSAPYVGYRRLRHFPTLVAIAAIVASQVVLRDDYHALHGFVVWAAVLLAAPVLAPLVERSVVSALSSRRGRVALAVLAIVAVSGVVVPPPNATRYELFRQPNTLAPWTLATFVWPTPETHRPVTPAASPWNDDRSKAPPVAATEPPIFSSPPVVVLLTIDALRGEVLDDPSLDGRFPVLSRIKREGIVFRHASAPGAMTVVSLSSLFSGKYFSERRWEDYGTGPSRYFFPARDPSPGFPDLLTRGGVAAADYPGYFILKSEFGLIRGFSEQKLSLQGASFVLGNWLVASMVTRLKSTHNGPLFLYTHLLDVHEPYGNHKGGADYENYLSQVAFVDGLVGRVLDVLTKRFGQDWALFLSSDHGEAFGEHDTFKHCKTLYEELLHIPLLALSPRFTPRTVEQRVGLIDLGPTILDLFHQETPATFEGQSLVPLLRGEDAGLTRPLLAEGRLRRSLTLPDGFKVIDDPLRKTVETYDLAKDPKETRNLFDAEADRSDAALAELRAFFANHTLREGDYEPPYFQ